jgi:hypothetical protein
MEQHELVFFKKKLVEPRCLDFLLRLSTLIVLDFNSVLEAAQQHIANPVMEGDKLSQFVEFASVPFREAMVKRAPPAVVGKVVAVYAARGTAAVYLSLG